MAFRIAEAVVRGEVDNRTNGRVRGRVWLEGRAEPLLLELAGNAWPDLAGCVMTFRNTRQAVPDPEQHVLSGEQRGTVGDLTASRKVRVYDIPAPEAYEMSKRGERPPEHLANCVYLEWFSEANGRVVIESVDFEVTISAPEWRLSPEEEKERAELAAQGMTDFLGRAAKAIRGNAGTIEKEEPWDEHDYEQFLKESEARTEMLKELMEKHGTTEEAWEKIAEAMGWNRELTEEEQEEQELHIEELNAACREALDEPEPEPPADREGVDWVRTEDGRLAHPLQQMAVERSIHFTLEIKRLGLEELADDDLYQFISEMQITGAKLAGALGTIARGQWRPEPAFTVAYLKRALDHLHRSQAGLEGLAPRHVLPEAVVIKARATLFEIREEILRLMEEFRRQ